jgi:acetyl esterase
MALHPQAQAVLDAQQASGAVTLPDSSPEEARRIYNSAPDFSGPRAPVAAVEDRVLSGPGGDLTVRIYSPDAPPPAPALIYFHGGGWVMGSIDAVDAPLRAVANGSGCVICSVDYRLAPEHPFPAALDDARAVLGWVAEETGPLGVDAGRIALGGDSAGGNLTAATTLAERDRGHHIAGQVLIYPVLDHDFERPSYVANADGFGMTRDHMKWYWDHYLPDPERRSDPLASPLRATDLSALPPALVVTAEHDVLRDEAEKYAARLRAAGVPVTLSRYDGMMHGFFRTAGAVDGGRALIDEIAAWLRTLPSSEGPKRAG